MTSEDIIKQMRKALKAFGSYQFEDKGPEEVMDLEPIVAHIRDLSAADARAHCWRRCTTIASTARC